jgi:hypothetical protein
MIVPKGLISHSKPLGMSIPTANGVTCLGGGRLSGTCEVVLYDIKEEAGLGEFALERNRERNLFLVTSH